MYAAQVVNNVFYFYFLLIIIRIFLTWIPSIDWYSQPFRAVADATDLYLNIFRRIIPPIGGLDFSPIIAIFVLEIIQRIVVSTLVMVMG
ncbi:YggT family protein [bacterium]|nr:YggT family protein [bacterium]